MSNSRSILGSGFAFPPQLAANGGIAMSDDEKSVRESISIILGTTPGERVMRPDFGCAVNDLVFAPNDSRTLDLACHHIEQALIRWEPRIILEGVEASYDTEDDTRLNVNIKFLIRSVNSYFNMVYPFFLERGEIDTQSQFG